MREQFSRQMEHQLSSFDIHLTEGQLWKFYRYYELLVDKNKVMNLTAITEESDVVTKHFVDSLSIISVLPWLRKEDNETGCSIIDVGTGAGFPGIPLKIAFPHCQITLLDSLNKRVDFLQEVCRELELENIYPIHERAEIAGRDERYREKFDCCVSRAVANLSTLSEYCMPFVKVGGNFISYKSKETKEEVKAARKGIEILGGSVKDCFSFLLPETDISRSFVVVRKEKKTSKKYPRRAGIPSKEPL